MGSVGASRSIMGFFVLRTPVNLSFLNDCSGMAWAASLRSCATDLRLPDAVCVAVSTPTVCCGGAGAASTWAGASGASAATAAAMANASNRADSLRARVGGDARRTGLTSSIGDEVGAALPTGGRAGSCMSCGAHCGSAGMANGAAAEVDDVRKSAPGAGANRLGYSPAAECDSENDSRRGESNDDRRGDVKSADDMARSNGLPEMDDANDEAGDSSRSSGESRSESSTGRSAPMGAPAGTAPPNAWPNSGVASGTTMLSVLYDEKSRKAVRSAAASSASRRRGPRVSSRRSRGARARRSEEEGTHQRRPLPTAER